MNENNHEGFNYYLKQKWKLSVTLFSLFVYLTMGFHLEISGSTMFQLSRQVETSLGELGWIVAARSLGYMLSVILFGVIFQSLIKNHSELVLSISYILPAAATISTPHIKSLWLLCIALLFQGISQGLTDLGLNILVTNMWKEHSTGPLNCVYLGYAIGALLSIFIVGIFRSNENTNPSSELIVPYTIASIFCIISSIGLGLIAYKESKNKKDVSIKKEEIKIESKSKRIFNKGLFWKTCSPTTCGQGYFIYGFILILLLFLFNFFFGGTEQMFTKFFISFIESEEKDTNLYSMIFYWFPMLIGRIICTFLTILWFTPEIMLTICLLFQIITYILWLICIWYIGLTKLIVFILVSLTGLSISSISPTLIGWTKLFLSLNPIEMTYLLTGNAFGGIIFGLISGYIFKYIDKKHLFTLLILSVLSCSIVFLLIILVQFIHSKQRKRSSI